MPWKCLWTGVALAGLAACEPEPRKAAQPVLPEARHFETQVIRREVDRYKENPSPEARRKMERAFTTLDGRVHELEAQVGTLTGDERVAMEAEIANLKRRRDLHWERAQTAMAQLEPVEKAQPVAERSSRGAAARAEGQTAERQLPAKAYRQRRVYRPVAVPSEGLFQRIGRLFHSY